MTLLIYLNMKWQNKNNNSIFVLLFFSLISCNNILSPGKIYYRIPNNYSFPNIDSAIFLSTYDTLNMKVINYDKDIIQEIQSSSEYYYNNLKFKKPEIYYEKNVLLYLFNDDSLTISQLYNPNNDLITKKIILNCRISNCSCYQNENQVYIGDFKINEVVYKNVIKLQDCNCLNEIYANYSFGVIQFKLNDVTYSLKNPFI